RSIRTPSTWSSPRSASTAGSSSYTARTATKRSPWCARRALASAIASASRSSPITRTPGTSSRIASVWPPMPSVQSTSTAPGALSAGASSSTQRRSSTGAWRRAASSSRSLIGAPRGGGGKWRVVVGRPLRRPTRSPTDPPGAGEVASGRAGGDLAGRGEGRQGLEGSVGEHLLLGRGVTGLLLGEVGLPGLEVPDLGAAPDADHGDVALEAGVGAQDRRDRDAALLVGHLV